MFSVQVTREERGTVLSLCGELDFDSAVQLHEAAGRELARGRGAGPVVADCARLEFCDSSGIGALVELFQRLTAQERVLRLAAVPDPVARLFAMTGLDRLFALHDGVEQALGADAHGRDAVAAGGGAAAPVEERRTP
ncbi:STAS domain-containing protein [Kitasatospora fiedleri]|uniref:STAS domain-containing protein n=1 Tax=Kitasatospora fiedleri TaxID=2991545 RepID=UPI00249C09F5|nr:STAS domain-containing protein [Kitasatospora fiedleri]